MSHRQLLPDNFKSRLLSIRSDLDFNALALEVFNYQYKHCLPYQKYCNLLNFDSSVLNSPFPFLPVEFFRSHSIIDQNSKIEKVFSSSNTGGGGQSFHAVHDISIYELAFTHAFERLYGPISSYAFLALLPSYLEREGSSLVYMVNHFIQHSKYAQSAFYLHNHADLQAALLELKQQHIPTILWGVTFALLDFSAQFQCDFPELIVMETGGMKGRGREPIRSEVHAQLSHCFGSKQIHSEYGMTELLSQGYALEQGMFECPPWMRIVITDINDPMRVLEPGQSGRVCIIDLANIHSCSFLQTSDLGKLHSDGRFEILGRMDFADMRGCSLLTA